jgi:hypothetical protein
MTTAMGVASKAATAAFYTAKDVYHTLQARNAYSPPRSSWTPPTETWTPPPSTWTPVQPTWSPPDQQWVQPDQSAAMDAILGATVHQDEAYVPLGGDRMVSPMQQLVEMGFADRELNAEILAGCEDNVELAVQELILVDQGWSTTRH